MAEFPELGQHCSKDGCNQLDFLPLQCSHCDQVFCKDHLSVDGHNCSECPNKLHDVGKLTEEKWWKCSIIGCKSNKDPVHQPCHSCGAHICLLHRHDPPEHHLCPFASKEGTEKGDKYDEQEKGRRKLQNAHSIVEKEIDGRLQNALSSKKAKDKDMANRLRLMRMKSRAIGDPTTSVPMSSRAHFDVLSPSSQTTNTSSVPIYVSKTWSLGRATDAIERILKPPMKSGQKLRLYVFHSKSLVSSDMSQTVGSLIENGSLIDGETLLLDFTELE